MPNPIKAFFEKKKAEAKFKMAGPGQKLGDSAAAERAAADRMASAQAAIARNQASTSRSAGVAGPSQAQQHAAQAALARLTILY